MLTRRILVGFAAVMPALASAQSFQSQAIRLVIPYPPGGGTDTLARPFSEAFRQQIGQPVVLEHRPGAATIIGMEHVARATPDGHTLIVNADNVALFPHLYRRLPWDLFRDFTPITYMAETPLVIAAHPHVPAATLQEFVALVRSRPEHFAFANPSIGSPHHLGFELLAREAGLRMLQPQYRGGGPATADVIAGHAHLGVFSLGSVSGHIAAGRLRPYALLSTRRSSIAPDIPTTAEVGLPQVVNALRFLMLAPAGVPAPVLARLHEAATAALADPTLREGLTRAGFEMMSTTPQEAAGMLRAERDRWAPILASLNIQLD